MTRARAGREWGWQFVFPSTNRSADPETGVIRRHHIYPDTVHRAIKRAVRAAGINKPVSCHTLRHSFAITCCKRDTTSGQFRSFSDIRTYRRR